MAAAEPLARARLAGKRLGIAVIFSVAALFIGASALEIVPAVFGAGAEPLSQDMSLGRDCARGLRDLERALDRATAQSMIATTTPAEHAARPGVQSGDDEDAALLSFRERLRPEWDTEATIVEKCRASPHGVDAVAALTRLRRADEELVRHQAVEIAPLRRDVAAYLPPAQ